MYSKIIKKITLAFAVFFLVQGCSKKEVLELTPEFALEGVNSPTSLKQVEEILTGAYSSLKDNNYYGSGSGTGAGWALMPDVMSDNLYENSAQTLANSRAMADFIFNATTAQIATLYSAPYVTIAHANAIIQNIDKFANAANQTQVNRIKGQAYGLRAMAHFDLFRYFAVKYDRNSTTDLALAYTKTFPIISSSNVPTPARLSNKDFYDNLFADISQATTLLNNIDRSINSASGLTRQFMDVNAVYALSARVNLYAGDWTTAISAATNALSGRPLATTQAAFSGMYNQTNRGELIWNVQFEAGEFGPSFLVYFATSNRNYFRPAPEVAVPAGTSGLIRSNDVRFTGSFRVLSGALSLGKYKGKGELVDGNANFPVFRSGEMYLIRAEAQARLGGAVNEALAMADLNALRAARITGYIPEALTGTALLNAIADERRRELVCEGHRFFDLKRTTRVLQRGSICGQSASAAGTCALAATAREWALPIPQTVLGANTKLVQNPGY